MRLGKYELIERLSTTGMAELYLARQPGPHGFEKIVTVRRLLPEVTAQPEVVRAFLGEARMAARLSHPSIVQIFDLGSTGKEYFLAMEHVDGRDLATVQERAAKAGLQMSAPVAAHVVSRVCAALNHAHTLRDIEDRPLGLVHRDVNPHSVLLSFQGDVKLVGFGLARATELAAETQAGLLQGKHGYMSPEQGRNEEVGPRSDIFAAGILLYELICHRRLFRRNTEPATVRAVLEDPIPPPSAVVEDVPDEIEAVIMRALTRDPSGRYADARLMELDLDQAMKASGWHAGPDELADYLDKLFPADERAPAPRMAAPEASTTRRFIEAQTQIESGAPSAPAAAAAQGLTRTATQARGSGPSARPAPSAAPGPAPVQAVRTGPLAFAPTQAIYGGEETGDPEDERTQIQTRPAFEDIVEEVAEVVVEPEDAPTEQAPPPGQQEEQTVASFSRPHFGDDAASPPEAPAAPLPKAVVPPPAPAASAGVSRSFHVAADGDLDFPAAEEAVRSERAGAPMQPVKTMAVGTRRPGQPLWLWASIVVALLLILGSGVVVLLKYRAGADSAGGVVVTSDPPGASVQLDSEKRFGVTPLTLHGVAPSSSHTLLLTLEGYHPWTKRLAPGERAVAAKLRPASPTGAATLVVKVDGEATGAEVYLDGELRGVVPLTLQVPIGSHTVVIKKEGFDEHTVQLRSLAAGETHTVSVKLVPESSNLLRGIEDRPAGKRGTKPKKVKDEGPVTVPRASPALSPLRNDNLGERLPSVPPTPPPRKPKE